MTTTKFDLERTFFFDVTDSFVIVFVRKSNQLKYVLISFFFPIRIINGSLAVEIGSVLSFMPQSLENQELINNDLSKFVVWFLSLRQNQVFKEMKKNVVIFLINKIWLTTTKQAQSTPNVVGLTNYSSCPADSFIIVFVRTSNQLKNSFPYFSFRITTG